MTAGSLDPDTTFDLLSNERRRHLLCLLAQRGGEVSLQNAAVEIFARIEERDPDTLSEQAPHSVYVSLYQNHAPRLAEAGIVRYDAHSKQVTLVHAPRTRELFRLLDCEFTERWHTAYPAVLGSSFLVGAASYFGPLPVIETAWLLPGSALAVGIAMIGMHQYYTRNKIEIDECRNSLNSAR